MTTSVLRLPSQSERAPEKIFVIDAVASATPSSRPTSVTLAPSAVTRNRGNSAWIISEETSMQRLTSPSAQTPRGMERKATGEAAVGSGG